jgi:hypothetical protein
VLTLARLTALLLCLLVVGSRATGDAGPIEPAAEATHTLIESVVNTAATEDRIPPEEPTDDREVAEPENAEDEPPPLAPPKLVSVGEFKEMKLKKAEEEAAGMCDTRV